jgi:hypothetical protein
VHSMYERISVLERENCDRGALAVSSTGILLEESWRLYGGVSSGAVHGAVYPDRRKSPAEWMPVAWRERL